MAKRYEVYRRAVCGNVEEVVHGGDGTLLCCGRDTKLFSERTVDPADQPYKPVVEEAADGITLSVGKTPHVMGDDNHIQWVELFADGFQCHRYFKIRRQARGHCQDQGRGPEGEGILRAARSQPISRNV